VLGRQDLAMGDWVIILFFELFGNNAISHLYGI